MRRGGVVGRYHSGTRKTLWEKRFATMGGFAVSPTAVYVVEERDSARALLEIGGGDGMTVRKWSPGKLGKYAKQDSLLLSNLEWLPDSGLLAIEALHMGYSYCRGDGLGVGGNGWRSNGTPRKMLGGMRLGTMRGRLGMIGGLRVKNVCWRVSLMTRAAVRNKEITAVPSSTCKLSGDLETRSTRLANAANSHAVHQRPTHAAGPLENR